MVDSQCIYVVSVGNGLYIGEMKEDTFIQVNKNSALKLNLDGANTICNCLVNHGLDSKIEFIVN